MKQGAERLPAKFGFRMCVWTIAVGLCVTSLATAPPGAAAQSRAVSTWSGPEAPIAHALAGLRSTPDDVRARETKRLALDIRALPAGDHKLMLASDLASLATEGDFGRDTLQEVATTLAGALAEHPAPESLPSGPYLEVAQLVRYEHVQASLSSPRFAQAMSELEADDQQRQEADFTLTDLEGKAWSLKSLRGKVVLVNFWATWCPPCRKEMPDLEWLHQHFQSQGLVILAISDEEGSKVKSFIGQQGFSYTVLLDPGRKVNTLFHVRGIPKSFIYDRTGKLAAESIDMRTRPQFLSLLAQAGLE
jgi:peroxiredoxin